MYFVNAVPFGLVGALVGEEQDEFVSLAFGDVCLDVAVPSLDFYKDIAVFALRKQDCGACDLPTLSR